MRHRIFIALLAGLHWSQGSKGVAAELGDVNGDGRVSFADAWRCAWWLTSRLPQFEPAPGSLDDGGAFGCVLAPDDGLGYALPGVIEIEGLRRAVPAALPHFLVRWPEPTAPPRPPPAPDPQVLLEVLPAANVGHGAEVTVRLRMTCSLPVASVQLVLKAEGLDLRPPLQATTAGDTFSTSAEYTLITGGLLVYHTAFPFRASPPVFPAGTHELSLPASLVKGTPAGVYSLKLVDGTEVVPLDRKLAPIVPQTSSGQIEVLSEVNDGPVQPLPAIRFDEAERRVLGETELRVTDAAGAVGDEVEVKVQLRTERPLNDIGLRVQFDGWALRCVASAVLLADPVDGVVHPDDGSIYFQNSSPWNGERHGAASLNYSTVPFNYQIYRDDGATRLGLKHIPPGPGWIDVASYRFQIREGARGRESTQLVISSAEVYTPAPTLVPYIGRTFGLISGDRAACDQAGGWWAHETALRAGTITVLGAGDIREPGLPISTEEAGIRYALGEAEGMPGEVVRVPIHVESRVDLFELVVMLQIDTSRVELVGFELDYVDGNGDAGVELLGPGVWSYHEAQHRVCESDISCSYGYPASSELYGPWRDDVLPEGIVAFKILKSPLTRGYSALQRWWQAGSLQRLGNIVLRIREGAPAGRASVTCADVVWKNRDLAMPLGTTCGAKPVLVVESLPDDPFERYDVPALEVEPGIVLVRGGAEIFLRGDGNGDGVLGLSDAVRELATLFQGDAPLECLDAADANDDGKIDISDAIHTLSYLFLGGPAPPEPFPDAGVDPTADGLGCAVSL